MSMNEPEIKIGRNGHGSWTAETYALGHLITTTKHGKHVVCSARVADMEEDKHGVNYRYDPTLNPSFELERGQFNRVTPKSVGTVHSCGLHKFFTIMSDKEAAA